MAYGIDQSYLPYESWATGQTIAPYQNVQTNPGVTQQTTPAYNNQVVPQVFTQSTANGPVAQPGSPVAPAPATSTDNRFGRLPGDSGPQQQGPSDYEIQMQKEAERMRGNINSAYDNYGNQINDLINSTLPGQKSAQEKLAQSNYDTGVSNAGIQKEQSLRDVNSQQNQSLKDLGENVRNLFQSGNIYLGARGAGDSSATNQYSYAISKLGQKARTEILNQANTRINQINDVYNTEKNRLTSEMQTRISGISDWFSNAQTTLKTQLGQLGLSKSQDLNNLSQTLYNQALAALQAVRTEMAQKQTALETWAMNNSKDWSGLVSNMKNISGGMPQFQGLAGTLPSFNSITGVPIGYSATPTKQKDIFGNVKS